MLMAGELDAMAWPLERAGEAMEALARAARLPLPNPLPALSHVVPGDPSLVDSWLDAGAHALGLELQPHYTRHGDVERVLGRAAPALV